MRGPWEEIGEENCPESLDRDPDTGLASCASVEDAGGTGTRRALCRLGVERWGMSLPSTRSDRRPASAIPKGSPQRKEGAVTVLFCCADEAHPRIIPVADRTSGL